MQYDSANEVSLLGSMILEPSLIPEIEELVRAEYFVDERHALLFSHFCQLYHKNTGEAWDLVLLRDDMNRAGTIESVGGLEYLKKLANCVPSSANAKFYANNVRLYALEQRMKETATTLSRSVNDPMVDIETKQAAFQQAAMEAEIVKPVSRRSMKDIMLEMGNTLMTSKKTAGDRIPTGFWGIDEKTGGVGGGDIVIIAARSSVGKTAFALDLALNMAAANKNVLFFSLEMKETGLAERMMSSTAQVPMSKIRYGGMDTKQWEDVLGAMSHLSNQPIVVDVRSELTPAILSAAVLAAKNRKAVDCVIVDYLQLMRLGTKADNRQHEIAQITRMVKGLALRSNLPIILLCQLNRDVDSREDHRPRTSDLRESGAIEQDADIVILLHRPDHYRRMKDPKAEMDGAAFAIVAKNRQSKLGDVELVFIDEYTTFKNKV